MFPFFILGAQMDFNDNDLHHLQQLVKILDHAKYDNLSGQDIIAFYRTFEWAGRFITLVTKEVEEKKALDSVKVQENQELKSPVKEPTPEVKKAIKKVKATASKKAKGD